MSILQFFLYSSVTYSNIKLALLWNGFIFCTLLFVYLTLARDIGGVWDCTKHVQPSSRLALVSLGPPVFVNLVCVCVCVCRSILVFIDQMKSASGCGIFWLYFARIVVFLTNSLYSFSILEVMIFLNPE